MIYSSIIARHPMHPRLAVTGPDCRSDRFSLAMVALLLTVPFMSCQSKTEEEQDLQPTSQETQPSSPTRPPVDTRAVDQATEALLSAESSAAAKDWWSCLQSCQTAASLLVGQQTDSALALFARARALATTADRELPDNSPRDGSDVGRFESAAEELSAAKSAAGEEQWADGLEHCQVAASLLIGDSDAAAAAMLDEVQSLAAKAREQQDRAESTVDATTAPGKDEKDLAQDPAAPRSGDETFAERLQRAKHALDEARKASDRERWAACIRLCGQAASDLVDQESEDAEKLRQQIDSLASNAAKRLNKGSSGNNPVTQVIVIE